MGLAEKRRFKEFRETLLPEVARRFRDETGLDLPIEVDLDSFATIADVDKLNDALDWLTGSTNSGEFWDEPISAWKEVAADDLGRAAVKDRIKTWRVRYQAGTPSGVTLSDGVLLHNANFVLDGSSARLFRRDFLGHLERELRQGGLGLSDRRSIKQIRDEVVPKYQGELAAVVGKDIPIEVTDDFAAIADDEVRTTTLDWLRGWINDGEFWSELVSGFGEVCHDDEGKAAVAESIHKIVVTRTPKKGASLTLKDGTLTYGYEFAELDEGGHRLFAGEVQRQLESLL
jgi:hypothetical protein